MNRYFIAIIPEDPLFGELETMKTKASQLVQTKAAFRSPAHITLHLPFLFNSKDESIIEESISSQLLNQDPFFIQCNNFNHFGDKVIFVDVLTNESLNDLQKKVILAMKKLQIFNQLESGFAFHPHFTIAFRDLNKEKFKILWDYFSSKKINDKFLVNQVHLLKFLNNKWITVKKIRFNESIAAH